MRHLTYLTSAALLLTLSACADGGLKSDEEAIHFPTSASWDAEQHAWRLPLHAWVFEAESDSLWRNGMMDTLKAGLGLEPDSDGSHYLKERGWRFLVDNERGKRLTLRIGGHEVEMPETGADGHSRGEALLPLDGKSDGNLWIEFETVMAEGDERRFGGQVQLIGEHGVSVVSDIDDTIKHTHVLDRKAMMENTLLREFRAVPRMAALYRGWAEQGVVFHYVTGSPWQLYPPLRDFMQRDGFPRGGFIMRHFRLKDESLVSFLSPSYDYKVKEIDALMRRYPQRRFILVGDSGEYDPEVYGEIARRFPGRVIAIYIRNVTEESLDSGAYDEAMAGTDGVEWRVFTSAETLSTTPGLNLP